ncbi:MAG: hypothetical protein HWQ23_00100 [Nostoc sp. JL33]|uniref:hypothetical protein n=1 Tax=Nostoc sp. JL33 TaxID=2815396 RepID=UPI0025EEA2E6|nr:hypothetical protein [Nostoc sp. JL33]MBN3868781.1 hypothetical protein [Nostoc sp. JL33]
MTHIIYSQQQLQLKSIAQLKQIYSEIACTVEVSDKRCKDYWISAIADYQSSKIQKLTPAAPDNQALAQAELDNYIADQAQAIAPEPLRIVEISFDHHEYYAGNQLIASISHDDNHLTQRWVAKPIRNYQFAIRSYFPVRVRQPTNLQLSNWNLAYRKLRIANCELTIVLDALRSLHLHSLQRWHTASARRSRGAGSREQGRRNCPPAPRTLLLVLFYRKPNHGAYLQRVPELQQFAITNSQFAITRHA